MAQLAMQPRAGQRPPALQRSRRHAHHVGRLFDAHAGKVAKLHDFRLLRIELLELVDCFVERGEHRFGIGGKRQRVGDRDAVHAAPAFLRAPGAGALDQNLPHRSRGDAHEMTLIVPGGAGLSETQVRFMDERRRLKRLAGALAAHVGRRNAPKLVVDDRRNIFRLRRFIGHAAFGVDSSRAS